MVWSNVNNGKPFGTFAPSLTRSICEVTPLDAHNAHL